MQRDSFTLAWIELIDCEVSIGGRAFHSQTSFCVLKRSEGRGSTCYGQRSEGYRM